MEARKFFDHPTQRRHGMVDPADLHDDGIEYWAHGPLCLAFHDAPWPDVQMVHCGAMPEAWGHAAALALPVLHEFWQARQPARIVAWIKEANRPVAALMRRVGFTVDGRMDLPTGAVLLQGWRP